MVERRTAWRRGSNGADVKKEGEKGKPARTPSRRRSRGAAGKEDGAAAVEGRVDDEVIGEGMGTDLVDGKDASSKRSKRRRDHAPSKAGVRALDSFVFFNNLLVELISNPDCEDFLKPVLVLWKEADVPGYKEKIKHPMDLGTIKEKLRNDKYTVQEKPNEFHFDTEACANDIRLIFENCMEYNDPESGLHLTALGLLTMVNTRIAAREKQLIREQENAVKKAKRDSERRRRKQAEEEAAAAAANAKRAALALEKVRKDAEEAERKRQLELKRKEAEWQQRMEAEKQAAVALAVQEALSKQQKESARRARLVTTSSVSSDEHEASGGEVTFAFVSTAGMEKKRGRKSAVVMQLESTHEELMRRRKAMVDSAVDLERLKQLEMTYAEKRKICDEVAELDFVRMKAVADIIAKGMNRPDILNEVDVDIDVDHIDNVVLREVQYFLNNPVATSAKDALRKVEKEIEDVETKLVDIRYQKVN